jgi:hypothetical protein
MANRTTDRQVAVRGRPTSSGDQARPDPVADAESAVAAQRVRSLAGHRAAVRRGDCCAVGHRRITDLAGDSRNSPRVAGGRRRGGAAARRAHPQPARESLRRAHQPGHIAGHVALWSLSEAGCPVLRGRSARGLSSGCTAGACRLGTGCCQASCRLLRAQANARLVQFPALRGRGRQHGRDHPARWGSAVGAPAGSAGTVAGRGPDRRGYCRPRHGHRRKRQPRPAIRASRLRGTIRVPCQLPGSAAGRRVGSSVAARSLPAPRGADAPAERSSEHRCRS